MKRERANENSCHRNWCENSTETFADWAIVAHKDDSGFGRQAEDMKAVLGTGRQIVIPSEKLWDKPFDEINEIRLQPNDSLEQLTRVLEGLKGILFFERHSWHPLLLQRAKELGLYTVCIPNWEWFNGADPKWKLCDLFITSSRFSLSIVRSFGYQNSVCLPWTVDISRLPRRKVTGPGRLFVHNAGLIDPDDRKGTWDTINAFKKVKIPDIRLLVRMQKAADLPKLDDRIEVRVGNLDDPADLYREGDVAIQPSKMEGNGFMVLEPVCSGMPVITLDYPPMSEFVRQKEMRVRKRWFKRKAYPTAWVKHAHLRLPDINDLAKKIQWCAQNGMTSISLSNQQWADSMFNRSQLRQRWSEAIQALVFGHLLQFIKERDEEQSL